MSGAAESSTGAEAAAVLRLIASLDGVRDVRILDPAAGAAVLAAEERYESDAELPLENLGVRLALARETVVVILKDATFRKPPSPTLYLVEEADPPPGEALRIADRVYHVIGEEIVAEGQRPAEGAVPLSDTFVYYPGRRTRESLPSRFLLPPVAFPETAMIFGSDALSASPSPLGDACLRRECGYVDDPSLATLLVGFGRTRSANHGGHEAAGDRQAT